MFLCNLGSLSWIRVWSDVSTRHWISLGGIRTVIHRTFRSLCRLYTPQRVAGTSAMRHEPVFRGQTCQLMAARVDWLMIVTQQVSVAHVRKVPVPVYYWNKSKSPLIAFRIVTGLCSERWRSGGSIHHRDILLYSYASKPFLELPEHCAPGGDCTICHRDVHKGKYTPVK